MNQPIPKLTVQVTKTSDGQNDYVQILSGDQFSINVVLIASNIEIQDRRVNPAIRSMDVDKQLDEAISRIYAKYGTNLQAFFDDVSKQTKTQNRKRGLPSL